MTETVTAEVEVDAPVHTVYDQWTQFEDFPRFLHAVKRIDQIDDMLTHWVVSIGGVQREFDAAIVDQVPDDHVAWASVDERIHAGRVAFTPTGSGSTKVRLEMSWEPETLVEKAGAKLNIDQRQVEMDLQRFREFLEERGAETGAWRGEIHDAQRTDTRAGQSGEAGLNDPMRNEAAATIGTDEASAGMEVGVDRVDGGIADGLLDPASTETVPALDEWDVEDTTTGDGHPPRSV